MALTLFSCVRRAVGVVAIAMAFQAGQAAARPWSVSTMGALQTECGISSKPAALVAGNSPPVSGAIVASTVEVGGVRLADRVEDLTALRILLGDEPALRLDRRRLPSGCMSADCAADAVFGRGVGVRLLHLLVRYGYNASPTAARDAQPWTAAQLDEIISVFEALPPSMFRRGLAYVRPLVLVPTPPASQRIVELGRGDHGIRLASLWALYDPQARRGVLLHELAHNIRGELALEESDPHRGPRSLWSAAARPQGRISDYAGWSDDEDFAESFVAYLRMPMHLKAVSPDRYEFMRRHIFGEAAPACPAADPAHRTQTVSNTLGRSAILARR